MSLAIDVRILAVSRDSAAPTAVIAGALGALLAATVVGRRTLMLALALTATALSVWVLVRLWPERDAERSDWLWWALAAAAGVCLGYVGIFVAWRFARRHGALVPPDEPPR